MHASMSITFLSFSQCVFELANQQSFSRQVFFHCGINKIRISCHAAHNPISPDKVYTNKYKHHNLTSNLVLPSFKPATLASIVLQSNWPISIPLLPTYGIHHGLLLIRPQYHHRQPNGKPYSCIYGQDLQRSHPIF